MSGEPDQLATTSSQAVSIIHKIVDLGGSYPDVVQFLQQARTMRKLDSRLAFDAVPSDNDGRMGIHEEAAAAKRELDTDDREGEDEEIENDKSFRDASNEDSLENLQIPYKDASIQNSNSFQQDANGGKERTVPLRSEGPS